MDPVLALHLLLRWHAPPILCLHGVGSGPDALPVPVFRSLLDWLCERRYRFLTVDDATHLRVLRRRTVLLTFDDGRRDNVSVALPILREYGIRATFYACSELAGRCVTFPAHPDRGDEGGTRFDLLSWSELERLRDSGMCIGSHGATHRELTRCSDEELEFEVSGSRREMDERLGIRIDHFSYPWGRFDARVIEAVQRAGYRTAAAVSMNPWLACRPWDGFTLSRITVHPDAGQKELMRLIGFGNLFRRTLAQTRRCALARWGVAR